MCGRKWMLMLFLGLLHSTRFVRGVPILTITPTKWNTSTTLTVTCDLAGVTTTGLTFSKDISVLYPCLSVGLLCGHNAGISDYSDVDWSQTNKAIFTISNVTKARDNGEWTCAGDTGGASSPVTLSITDADCGSLNIENGNVNATGTIYGSTADVSCNTGYILDGNPTTTCQANGSWSGSIPSCKVSETDNDKCECWYYWLFILVLIPCVGLVVVIIIVSRYKTLVINTLYVKVTKNTVQLSWKPKFEPVPNTTYAKCAQNGLTENAEFIDGLFVVVFRDLTRERQHDVTVYCQNAADMKLYKSETCVVFTLKDSSNTNPKKCNPVLALHSLDMTVYQKKVELSWTSPIAFDSTKVEYWVGSDKHITISANKPSPATSTAEMTRLLPGRMITFTITGEKDGTKYPSGILHQKTLKGLTDCCP